MNIWKMSKVVHDVFTFTLWHSGIQMKGRLLSQKYYQETWKEIKEERGAALQDETHLP